MAHICHKNGPFNEVVFSWGGGLFCTTLWGIVWEISTVNIAAPFEESLSFSQDIWARLSQPQQPFLKIHQN